MGGSFRARQIRCRGAAATVLLAAAALAGADAERDALEACRNIADDTRRLACYDGIPPRAAAAVETVDSPVARTTPDAPPPPAPRPAHDIATVTDATGEDSNVVQRSLGRLRSLFGRETPEPMEKPPELQSITGQVVKIVKLARGNHSLTLEDGQVWRENEVKPRARYRVGDAVVIARGAFGAYNLSSERTGHRVKVRRIR